MQNHFELFYIIVVGCIFLMLCYYERKEVVILILDVFCLISIFLIALLILTVDFINQYIYIDNDDDEMI